MLNSNNTLSHIILVLEIAFYCNHSLKCHIASLIEYSCLIIEGYLLLIKRFQTFCYILCLYQLATCIEVNLIVVTYLLTAIFYSNCYRSLFTGLNSFRVAHFYTKVFCTYITNHDVVNNYAIIFVSKVTYKAYLCKSATLEIVKT